MAYIFVGTFKKKPYVSKPYRTEKMAREKAYDMVFEKDGNTRKVPQLEDFYITTLTKYRAEKNRQKKDFAAFRKAMVRIR